MLKPTQTGLSCIPCGADLDPERTHCPKCGKLSLTLLRRDVARGLAPLLVLGGLFFGALAAFTLYAREPNLISGTAAAIDDQFKPAAPAKK